MSPLIRSVLTQLEAALVERFGARVRSVVMFGSWARGEATEDSDLDVAVIIDGLTTAEWKQAAACAAEVEAAGDLAFSPFIVSSERFAALVAEGGIGADIQREGKLA